MVSNRAVVTGLGVVSPLGIGKDETWTNLIKGQSGIDLIGSFDASHFPVRIAAEVGEIDIKEFVDEEEITKHATERRTKFGLVASKMAVDDANIDLRKLIPGRVGVVTGAGLGIVRLEDLCRCMDDGKFNIKRFARELSHIYPDSILRCPPDLVSCLISTLYKIQGPNYTITSACAAGAQAIGLALRIIQRGEADIIIAGAADSMVNPMGIMGFIMLDAVSGNNEYPTKACRPFDRKRDGAVIGEGAGMVIVEELSHALERDVRIYGELLGYGTSMDAYRVTDPHPEGRGAIQSMQAALKDGGLMVSEIDYINAHGTSTPLNDKIETLAIKTLFGEHAYKVAVSSNKSMIGHLIAASGAVEFIATVKTVSENVIPPTINYEFADPDCDLDYVPNEARERETNIALTNSFGFGGHNATLAVGKYESS
ncbi:MAG: beta-ketoacyl-[acyl-carrier-protein] synthase family protein [Promethearchaeota archaeon]